MINRNKLVWILTAAEVMACNIKELLEMDGFSCRISGNINDVRSSLNGRIPDAFVLDELNNEGAYDQLIRMLPTQHKDIRIVVLCCESDKKMYPLAYSCLGLPLNIDGIPKVLAS